jgi:hypothetical protein
MQCSLATIGSYNSEKTIIGCNQNEEVMYLLSAGNVWRIEAHNAEDRADNELLGAGLDVAANSRVHILGVECIQVGLVLECHDSDDVVVEVAHLTAEDNRGIAIWLALEIVAGMRERERLPHVALDDWNVDGVIVFDELIDRELWLAGLKSGNQVLIGINCAAHLQREGRDVY